MSSKLPPLPEPDTYFRATTHMAYCAVYDPTAGSCDCGARGAALWAEAKMRAYGAACAAAEREKFLKWVADDSWAITFQTLGQYRTALLARARGET